ncbi:Fumarate reductase 2 [Zancudomyces culisetae]|uniref:Fumarate reductase 2 n=1 Tax=Zancudomyces culisetae TaxID=1213189 RepID=A0A1R1PR18_ZANCU|nr:Fumarate reductase 2 [Zancudomyces culisetae]|eukprot:OMH83381.1 Fumarate reductase 2 [Zancudomyces culisetae]
MEPIPNKVIIVGGGLAGMSAAIQAYLSSTEVAVEIIDKEARLGGNSSKASSGINGVNTKTQKEVGVTNDSVELFVSDTLKSGKGLSKEELVKKLVTDSTEAVTWLQNCFNLDLNVLAQLGGHSAKRTHRRPDLPDGRPQPVGWGITSTLSNWLAEESKKSNGRLVLHLGAKAKSLIANPSGRVVGVEVEESQGGDQKKIVGGAVILATGGFCGEGLNSVLLKKYAPRHYGLPTTNGAFATGDGIFLGQAVGAGLVDMEQVQVHPTGFVSMKDPTNNTKFLAAEALRGEGGILLNKMGQRFINELATRDAVTDAIFKNCSDEKTRAVVEGVRKAEESGKKAYQAGAFLVLSESAAARFGAGSLGFYAKMGLMNKAESFNALASAIGADERVLAGEFLRYDAAFHGITSEKYGKTVFPSPMLKVSAENKNKLVELFSAHESSSSTEIEDEAIKLASGDKSTFYWGIITPSLHYTMGGLLFNSNTQVLKEDGSPISGLYAAGEVTGGLHGANRLGGNSLLECVVYGSEAGKQAAVFSKSKI